LKLALPLLEMFEYDHEVYNIMQLQLGQIAFINRKGGVKKR